MNFNLPPDAVESLYPTALIIHRIFSHIAKAGDCLAMLYREQKAQINNSHEKDRIQDCVNLASMTAHFRPVVENPDQQTPYEHLFRIHACVEFVMSAKIAGIEVIEIGPLVHTELKACDSLVIISQFKAYLQTHYDRLKENVEFIRIECPRDTVEITTYIDDHVISIIGLAVARLNTVMMSRLEYKAPTYI